MRFALLVLSLLAPTAVASAAEDQTPILRCIAAAGLLAQSKDPDQANSGRMGTVYWLGRLNPALREAEIEKRINDLSAKVTIADLQRDLPRCGAEIKTRSDMMRRIGERARQSSTKR
jgi:hypothetical protein